MNIKRDKKIYLGVLIAAVLVLVMVVALYAPKDNSLSYIEAKHITPSPAPNTTKANETPTGEPITITGTVVCLKTKSSTEQQAQIANCAIGLRQDDGKSYALSSQDPYITGSLPSGQRVEINGLLSQQPSEYDIVGKINVTSIKL